MKVVVLGKIIQNNYDLNDHFIINNDNEKVFTKKPETVITPVIYEWRKVLEFESKIMSQKNSTYKTGYYRININEDTEVSIEKKVFRADESVIYLYSDYVVESFNVLDKSRKKELSEAIKEYNKYMINNDEIMKSYCKIHKLNPEEIDYESLYNILYL